MTYILTIDTDTGTRYATGRATAVSGIALTTVEESARAFATLRDAERTLARLARLAPTATHERIANELRAVAVQS